MILRKLWRQVTSEIMKNFLISKKQIKKNLLKLAKATFNRER